MEIGIASTFVKGEKNNKKEKIFKDYLLELKRHYVSTKILFRGLKCYLKKIKRKTTLYKYYWEI